MEVISDNLSILLVFWLGKPELTCARFTGSVVYLDLEKEKSGDLAASDVCSDYV
jgi:hypothetical protein